MLIDIPVTVTFDHDSVWRAGGRAMSRVFTMRFDTANDAVPAQYTNHYPPRDNARWMKDDIGLLFDLFTDDTDREIKTKAELDPESYAVKEHAV